MPDNIIRLPYTSEELLSLLASTKDGTVSMPSNNFKNIEVQTNPTNTPTQQYFTADGDGYFTLGASLNSGGWFELLIQGDSWLSSGQYRGSSNGDYSYKAFIPVRKGQTYIVSMYQLRTVHHAKFVYAGV